MNWTDFEFFREPQHQAFIWPGGRPAALLVHGFPGTPAEMRPLATLLQPMGWTVQGLRLPGFGADLPTLGQRRYEDWLEAVIAAQARLRVDHDPVMLVGYSMGGALALRAASVLPPDGLILLAPFTWQQRTIYDAGSALAPLIPRQFHPFRRANLRNPRLRTVLLNALPGLDLEDPEVEAMVRGLVVPSSVVRHLLRSGRHGYEHAADVQAPTLVIQGTQDDAVSPQLTRVLVQQLPHVVRYVEIDTGHGLIGEQNPAWPTVQEMIMDFAVRLEEGGFG